MIRAVVVHPGLTMWQQALWRDRPTAQHSVIVTAELSRFRPSRPFGAAGVRELARELGISPGILVGRLQRDGQVPPRMVSRSA
jgi:hypothetical protein